MNFFSNLFINKDIKHLLNLLEEYKKKLKDYKKGEQIPNVYTKTLNSLFFDIEKYLKNETYFLEKDDKDNIIEEYARRRVLLNIYQECESRIKRPLECNNEYKKSLFLIYEFSYTEFFIVCAVTTDRTKLNEYITETKTYVLF